MLKRTFDTLRLSFAAGLCIAVGGAVMLSLKDGSLFGNVCGALLFSLGLLTIVTRSLLLFTGKVGYVLTSPPCFAAELLLIWLGNFAGTFAAGEALRFTRFGGALALKAQALCEAKLADSSLSIFLLAVFCGMLMYIAADGYSHKPSALIVILPVTVFILCGFEHVIANMFLFSLSRLWTARTFLCLLIMTFGNAAGGALFHLLPAKK